MVGTRVAGYRIEALIGQGGMGAVYRAKDEMLGREVALKVIAPGLAQDERFRGRFLAESRIAASLDHPNVLPIYRAGSEGGLLYLAMRYVDGTDLARLLEDHGALDPERAVGLLAQIADALDAAHERGLVHRDVKPSNVLIGRAAGKEHCYLADFGLTKRAGSLSGAVSGAPVGTLDYVAPEQITDERLDQRADVYSLACVLYECLTGLAPFPRATDVALLWAHVHEEPAPPSQIRPELDSAIDQVVARALAKEPARRHGSASELVAEARAALGLVGAPRSPARASRRLLLSGAVLLALVGVAAAVLTLARGSGSLASVSPNSVGVIDPGSNRLVAEVPVGIHPGPIGVGFGAVWVANTDDETVSQIDIAARNVVRTVPLDEYPSDLVLGHESVWVAQGALANVLRIKPEYDDVTVVDVSSAVSVLGLRPSVRPWLCDRQITRLAVDARSVWHLCGNYYYGLVQIDARGTKGPTAFEIDLPCSPIPGRPRVPSSSTSPWIPGGCGSPTSRRTPSGSSILGQVW